MIHTPTIPIASGSEPEIEDCTEAVGSSFDFDDFTGDLIEPCDKGPVGQHQYSMMDGFKACIHCGRESEL